MRASASARFGLDCDLNSNPEGRGLMLSKFTKLGAATFALLATSLAAEAADMPVKGYYKGPPRSVVSYYNWTGFYAGINGGYGWGTSDWDSPATVGSKPKGGLIGGTVGYNYQTGAIVWGVEGDVAYSMIKDSTTCALGPCEVENKWLGTARGRIGYAFDRWLPYLTAGAAFGDVKATRVGVAAGGASDIMAGWTAGVGLEYAFLGNWTAKVEYLYADLGKFDCGTACGAAADNVTFQTNIIRAGLNYKFSGPVFSRF
jgi:outer membrane immunogenic protein